MTTSSIFYNLKIRNKRAVDSFINALEIAEKQSLKISESSIIPSMNKEQIREVFEFKENHK